MSCCYITTVDGGSRRLFLPNLLRTMVIVMVMMMMARSTSGGVSIESISPEFRVGSSARINITCKVAGDLDVVTVLKLLRNGTQVIQLNYNKGTGGFQRDVVKPGFDCKIPANKGWNGEYQCWKNNPNCEDVTTFQCATNNEVSSLKSVKMKSALKQLTLDNVDYELNQIITFICTANVATSSQRTVQFKWSVKQGSNNLEEVQRSVKVPTSNNCKVQVQSRFDYNITTRDNPNITITCSAFGMELHTEVSIVDKISILATQAPVVDTAGGLDGGTIAGIILGVIAFIILVVLLIWFFVIRKKGDTKDTKENAGPPPNEKDYEVRENAVYAKPVHQKGRQAGRAKSNPPQNNMDVYTVDTKGESNRAMEVDDEHDGGASYNTRNYAPGSSV